MLVSDAVAAGADASFTGARLWRVSRAGVPDSFVLGTIHIADPRVSRIVPPVADALARSRVLAMEIVPVRQGAEDLDELEQLEGGGRLEPLLGAAYYAQLRDELIAQGIPLHAIERMKPWAALLRVARTGRADGQRSLDENLFLAARERQMRVTSLELVEEQIAAFDTVPVDSQVALLIHALAHRDAGAARIEPTIRAWLRGDLAALAAADDAFPAMRRHQAALRKHLIDDRTVVMHHRLFLALGSGRVFIAVGAAHIHGDAGLLALLQRDGYRITRVW